MSRCIFLTLTGAMVILAGCAKKAPLTPATPWADVANDALCFLTTSTDPGNLKVQYIFDWGNGDTTTTSLYKSGDTACCPRSFPDTGTFHIKVQARNEQGRSSKWSDECLFHASRPPQLVDTIVGFTRWAVDRWYRPSVKVVDPDGDSVSVKFICGDSLASGWSPFVASGSTVTDSVKWQTTGRHIIHVLLKDKGSMVNSSAGAKIVNVSPMAILWSNYDENRYYYATPTLGTIDGEPVLYCLADDGVDCYTMEGRLRWRAPMFVEEEYAASLNADGSRLYLTDYDSGLVCLDARTGQTEWSLPQDMASGTPALGPDGAIYVTTGEFDCELKRVRDCGDSAVVDWRLPLGPYMVEGAVVGRNGVAYAIGSDNHGDFAMLVAAEPTGIVVWKDSARIHDGGLPVIDGRDRILVTDESGYLYCFNPDGSLARSVSIADPNGWSTALGRDDEVIVTDWNGRIAGYDSTGRQQWTSDLSYFNATNTPCVAQDSTIIAYDPEWNYAYGIGIDGQELWEFSIWDSMGYKKRQASRDEGDMCPSAVIGPNGDLYLASEAGLVCIACPGLSMANTAWPTYNHDNARSGWAGRH